MNTSYSLMSILLNAQLLLFSVTLPQANLIVTRHVSDLKMWIEYEQTLANFVYQVNSGISSEGSALSRTWRDTGH